MNKKTAGITFAAFMITTGVLSVAEKRVAANSGSCCAPGNPYHCDAGDSCDDGDCTILSGECTSKP
jgi:hypothetical protein